MQEWSDSIKIAVDVIVACVLIMAMLGILMLSHSIMGAVEKQRADTEIVNEYRTSAMYNGAVVKPQDVISVIVEMQGNPPVYVYAVGGWIAPDATQAEREPRVNGQKVAPKMQYNATIAAPVQTTAYSASAIDTQMAALGIRNKEFRCAYYEANSYHPAYYIFVATS